MPRYYASRGYLRHLNYGHVNITNINIYNYDMSRGRYANRGIPGAVTAVPRDVFLGGRAVPREAYNVDARAALRGTVLGSAAPLAPRTDSVLGRRTGYVSRPPAAALERTVVARTQPPAAPARFTAQERALQANGGRPLDDTTMARLRTESATNRAADARVRLADGRANTGRGTVLGSMMRGDRGTTAGGGGAVTRGERTDTESVRSGSFPSSSGGVRTDANDRPGWAGSRSGEVRPSNPRYSGGGDATVRGRVGAENNVETIRGGVVSNERPGARREAPSRGEGTIRSADTNDRPGSVARPSGGNERSRGEAGNINDRPGPSGGSGVAGARSRGGDSARPGPAPNSKPSGASSGSSSGGARPRTGSGGRGGDTSAYYGGESPAGAYATRSYSTDSNDRPSGAGTWRPTSNARPSADSFRTYGNGVAAGARDNDRPASSGGSSPRSYSGDSRPSAQYRVTPEYRSMPESRSVAPSRAVPDSRPSYSVPETRTYSSRPSSSVPDTRSYSRSVPETRSYSRQVPDARSYRSVPDTRSYSRSVPETRSYGGSGGGAPRGGARTSPAPRSQAPSGGSAAPRGGARGHGKGN
jgi:hypothetical protein